MSNAEYKKWLAEMLKTKVPMPMDKPIREFELDYFMMQTWDANGKSTGKYHAKLFGNRNAANFYKVFERVPKGLKKTYPVD